MKNTKFSTIIYVKIKMKINFNKMLGQGGFCRVFEGEKEDKKYAVKIYLKSEKYIFERESIIHSYLQKKDVDKKYVVPIYDYYSSDDFCYLIMEKMHLSLGDILKKINITFDEYSIRNIAKSIILSLRFIHKYGICHCDVKPENIIVSKDYQKIFLIDYGLSRFYRKNGKHIELKTDIMPSGTIKYMSVHTNLKVEISRRDDLISLGYMLVYLQKKKLPWEEIDRKDRIRRIGEMKLEIDFQQLCENCIPELITYFEYCYNLGFEEKPDYQYLYNLFDKNNLKENV